MPCSISLALDCHFFMDFFFFSVRKGGRKFSTTELSLFSNNAAIMRIKFHKCQAPSSYRSTVRSAVEECAAVGRWKEPESIHTFFCVCCKRWSDKVEVVLRQLWTLELKLCKLLLLPGSQGTGSRATGLMFFSALSWPSPVFLFLFKDSDRLSQGLSEGVDRRRGILYRCIAMYTHLKSPHNALFSEHKPQLGLNLGNESRKVT